jgi:predicted GNAT superfamily acetyltransferase
MLAEADAAAARASGLSGVTIEAVEDTVQITRVYDLFNRIWKPDVSNPPVTTELLRALTHAGNYLAAAYDGQEMVGACLGFFAAPLGDSLHSHIAGVSVEARGRSVGYALKLHQRAWAIRRGVSEITWTFDPLVRRNAYFNLVKLGALPREYLVDFYGSVEDAINAGQGSDRLLVVWSLGSPTAAKACQGHRVETDAHALVRSGAATALRVSETGRPVASPEPGWRRGPAALVQIPEDIEGMRALDPVRARDWRHAAREVMGGLIADGARITGFDRSGCYVFERAEL